MIISDIGTANAKIFFTSTLTEVEIQHRFRCRGVGSSAKVIRLSF